MQRFSQHTSIQVTRSGVIAPAMALAMLVALLILALVVDRIWLANCQVELKRTAEAAALAAARTLLSDELLLPSVDHSQLAQRAKRAAQRIARENVAAGQPVTLDLERGDVQVGRYVEQESTGELRFLQTDYEPKYVQVQAARIRSRNNPIALFMTGLSGATLADVRAEANATFDHDVVAVRPFAGGRVPVLPLAIRLCGGHGETWETAIDQSSGSDNYAFDASNGRITAKPDGIPEIVLRSASKLVSAEDANTHLMELGGRPGHIDLATQIRSGWSREDLDSYGGQIRFDGKPAQIACSDYYNHEIEAAFADLIGQPRLVILYREYFPADSQRYAALTADRLAAARLMAIRGAKGGGYEFVLQPAVMSTRTAVLASEMAEMAATASSPQHAAEASTENRYVYKVRLAH